MEWFSVDDRVRICHISNSVSARLHYGYSKWGIWCQMMVHIRASGKCQNFDRRYDPASDLVAE